MSSVRCPVLVGRRAELAALRTGVAAARLGSGQVAVLAGPPGIGKSRLARELAAVAGTWDVPVLVGRAVHGVGASAYRPLVEALLAPVHHTPGLLAGSPGARWALGGLLPQWRPTAEAAEVVAEPPVVVADAVLRLLAELAEDRALLLVLEDLHWADPETLAVLEYLADHASTERLSVVVTLRDDEPDVPAVRLVHALAARHACTLHRLTALDPDGIARMVTACLGGPVPAAVEAALVRRSGGTPLLVEELLAGTDPASHVPASFARSVADRLAALPAPARHSVEVAAVLGERIDRRLLSAVSGVDGAGADGPGALGALRAASGAGLLEAGDHPDELRFRHALARDAVLRGLLPAERAAWARQGLDRLRADDPELAGDRLQLAADLAVRAHDDRAAAALLAEAGRRDLARGALGSAEVALRRAAGLRPADPGIQDALAEVLASAGRTAEAVTVSTGLLALIGDDRAVACTAWLRLATVHEKAGDHAAAAAALAEARESGVDPLRVAVVGARLAIAAGELDAAAGLAAEALAGAERDGRSAVVVEALLLRGRLARRDDPAEAERLCERARAIADDAGLPVAAARATYEAAITGVQETLRPERLVAARDRALAVGDLAAAAVLDLEEAAIRIMLWDVGAALAVARRCVDTSRRLRLATRPKALALTAAAETLRGRPAAAEAAAAEALELAPQDTHLLGDVWHERASRALRLADDRTARDRLDRAMTEFGRRPDQVTGSPGVGLWVLVTTVLERERNRPPDTPNPVNNRWNRGLVGFAEAVARGRRGDVVAAAEAFDEADALMRTPTDIAWHRRQARRLVAGAALADGWGEPARWVREDLPELEARGEDRWCAALRGLLRRAGASVPRRITTALPARLRELGVTVREAEVLALVAEGLGNRVIAERLYLSPRTVEKHVERLFAKTGCNHRTELVAAGPALLRPDGGFPAARGAPGATRRSPPKR